MGTGMFDLSVQATGIVEGEGPYMEWSIEKKKIDPLRAKPFKTWMPIGRVINAFRQAP